MYYEELPYTDSLTEAQKKLFKSACAVGPPFMTIDPVVNHAVDDYVCQEVSPYDKDLYEADLLAWQKSGGYIVNPTGYQV